MAVGYADFYQVLGGHLLVYEGELLAVVEGDVVELEEDLGVGHKVLDLVGDGVLGELADFVEDVF